MATALSLKFGPIQSEKRGDKIAISAWRPDQPSVLPASHKANLSRFSLF
jgi:hypothetical protein